MTNSGLTQISVGDFHVCAVKAGEAYCWGRNTNGQIGDGSTTNRTTPVKVSAGAMGATTGVSFVGAGGITFGSEAHTCTLRLGELYCFGYRGHGRIGDGTSATSNPYTTPVAVLATPAAITVEVTITAASGQTATFPFTIRTAS
jgi:alpha-tubulin suppressor-like RCC1 family protein